MYLVRTTVSEIGEAKRISDHLVASGCSPCVQIRPVRSIYRWKGRTFDEEEVLLEAKVTDDRLDKAVSTIRGLHGYEHPAIEWFAMTVTSETAEWMRDETRRSP